MTVTTELTVHLEGEYKQLIVRFDRDTDDVARQVDIKSGYSDEINGDVLSCSLDDIEAFADALHAFVHHHKGGETR